MAEGPEAAPDEAGDAVESGRSGRRIGPSGPMSRVVRVCLIAVSASLLAGTAIPELALSLQNSALAGSADHPATAIARANLAVALFPLDAGALSTRAHVYETSAQTLAALGDSEQAGALLDNLALALDSSAQAVQREPSDWSKRYEAGMAALNLLLARDALDGGTLTANTSDLVGLEDWSGLRPLSGSLETIRAPGESAGSLATSPATIEAATRYRNMSQEELRALADAYFNQARDRYPHSPEVEAALITVRSLVSFLPARS